MNAPRKMTIQLVHLHTDTKRMIELEEIKKRRFLNASEALELLDIWHRQDARAEAAALAHDKATEAHAFPPNPNPHDD